GLAAQYKLACLSLPGDEALGFAKADGFDDQPPQTCARLERAPLRGGLRRPHEDRIPAGRKHLIDDLVPVAEIVDGHSRVGLIKIGQGIFRSFDSATRSHSVRIGFREWVGITWIIWGSRVG